PSPPGALNATACSPLQGLLPDRRDTRSGETGANGQTRRLRLGHVPQNEQALHFAQEPDRRAPGEDFDHNVAEEEHRVGGPDGGAAAAALHLAVGGEAVAGPDPLHLRPPGGEIPTEPVPGLRVALTDEMVPLFSGVRDHSHPPGSPRRGPGYLTHGLSSR